MALIDKSKLSDEGLEQVSGGYVMNNSDRYDVIDDFTGDVRESNLSYDEAIQYCQSRGLETKELSWKQLERLRMSGSIYGNKKRFPNL